jgi:fibronectin-binding autotransporter adhesin
MTGYVPALKVQPSATLYFSDTGSASGDGSLNKPFYDPTPSGANARREAIGTIAVSRAFTQTAANQWIGTSVRMPSGRDLNLSTVNNAGFDRLSVTNAAINTSLTISGGTGHKFENCELASGATVSWTGITNGGFAVFRDCDLNSVTITLPSLGSNTASLTFSRCSNVKVFGNTGWTVIFDDISGTVAASAGTVIALNSPNLRRVISGTAVDASMTASATLAASAPSTAGVYVLNYAPSGITEVTGATLGKGDMILYYGSSLALRVGAYEALDVVNIGGTTYIKDGSGGWAQAGGGGNVLTTALTGLSLTNTANITPTSILIDAMGQLQAQLVDANSQIKEMLKNVTYSTMSDGNGTTATVQNGATNSAAWSLVAGKLSTPAGSSATLSGILSGSGTFKMTSGGTGTLTGTNTYTGLTTVDASTTLNMGAGSYSGGIANSGTVVFNNGSAQTISGNLSGSGSFTNTGNRVLTLTGTNTNSGAFTSSTGTLKAGSASAFGTGAISITGTLDVNGLSFTGSTVSATGAVTIANTNATAGSFAGAVGMSSNALTLNTTGDLMLSGAVSGSGGITKSGAGTATLSNSSNAVARALTLNAGVLAMDGTGTLSSISGSGGFTKVGTGTVVINATSFSGPIVINGGTIKYGAGNNSGNQYAGNPSITVNSGGIFELNGTDNVFSAYTLAGGTFQNSAPNTNSQINSYNISVTADSTINVLAATYLIAGGFSAITVPLNGHTLTVTGTGTLYPANTTFTSGVIAINSGTLSQFNAGMTASTVAFTFANTAGATFNMNSLPASVGSLAGGGSTGGNIVMSGALTIGALGATTSYAGVISGGGSLVKIGAGTQTLSGTNTFSGTTTINAGTINANATPSFTTNGPRVGNSVVINNGGTLLTGGVHQFGWTGTLASITVNSGGLFNNFGQDHYINTIAVNGNATASGGGYLGIVGGSISYTGSSVSDAGNISARIALRNSSSVAVNVTIAVNGTNTSGDLVISGQVFDSGGVIKTGAGVLVLSASNTYTGGTTINAGTLKAGNANAFGTGTITVNSGATLNKGGFTLPNTIVNNGGTIIP